MMTLARAQAGVQYLRPTTVDLAAVIAESLTTYAPVAAAKSIRLEHQTTDGISTLVYADREATLTIANNVIGNAIRYTPEGGHVVASSGREGAFGVLIVRDNGIGMTSDVMRRAFEPFFTTKQVGAGTGLGLAMVYGIVRQSGGHMEVTSEPGVGSEFRLFLPAARRLVTPSVPQHRNGEDTLAGNETLLVVEDEESVRRLAVLALREHGYRVLEASNGAEALRTLGSFDGGIDMVVTDVVMPVMGGRQLVEALKPLRPDVRVLYVSGYTEDAVIRHGVQRADVAFLQKPYSPHDLARKVRSVLDSRD